MNRQPLRRFRRKNWQGSCGRCDFHLTGRELVSAVRTFGGRKCDNALAHWADLGRGLTAASFTGPLRAHQIDWPVAPHIARKIQNEAVLLPRCQARAATHHLDIKAS
jgi:hypothetical protein